MDGTDCTAEEMSKALDHSLTALGHCEVDKDPTRILVSNKVCNSHNEFDGSIINSIIHRMCYNLRKI